MDFYNIYLIIVTHIEKNRSRIWLSSLFLAIFVIVINLKYC